MKLNILCLGLVLFVATTPCLAQQDDRQTVAVPLAVNELGRPTFDQYLTPITQKITQILKQTKRFVVVNRSEDAVKAERDFQANPEFLDRMLAAKKAGSMEAVKDIIGQNDNYKYISFDTLASGEVVFRGADYLLRIELRKLDINRMANPDGSVNGYKTLLGLQISVIDAATNEIVDAEGFSSLPLKVAMTSPVRSVDESLATIEKEIYSYLLAAFPVKCKVAKIVENYFMINAGNNQGVVVGDVFGVAKIVRLDAQTSIEEPLGRIKVKSLSGSDSSVCNAVEGSDEIKAAFKDAQQIVCTLIKSKRK